MKRILIASCWAGLLVYCALAFIWGPTGLLAVSEAHSMALRMKENISALSSLNAGYGAEWQSISMLAESRALEARSLGYIAEGETIIRLLTSEKDPEPPKAGDRLSYEPSFKLSEIKIKQIALISSLAISILGMLFHILESRERRQRDTLVQDASRT